MATPALEPASIAASESERPSLQRVDDLFARVPEAALDSLLIQYEGQTTPLPPVAARLMHQIVHALALGRAMMLVPAERLLTTNEAADYLNISRPYLVQILKRGEIPFTVVGTHRRVRLEDLLAYKARRDATTEEALRELTRLSQELGLYDTPVDTHR